MKRKLIVEEWLSLDGHVSDKAGSLDFFVKHVRGFTAGRLDFLNSIDTILLGHKTYNSFSALWPERPVENDVLAEKINTVNKIVFSKSLKDAPWGKWTKAVVEASDPAAAVRKFKSLPGKNMVVWGSITLAQALMKEGLVDEYHLHLCPYLTGGGRKLFTDEIDPSALTLADNKVYDNGVVFLKYNVSNK